MPVAFGSEVSCFLRYSRFRSHLSNFSKDPFPFFALSRQPLHQFSRRVFRPLNGPMKFSLNLVKVSLPSSSIRDEGHQLVEHRLILVFELLYEALPLIECVRLLTGEFLDLAQPAEELVRLVRDRYQLIVRQIR